MIKQKTFTERRTQKKNPRQRIGTKKRYMKVMSDHVEENEGYEGPMALYEWFLQEWHRPLNDEFRQIAYLAAWAVSIDKGLVKL